MAENTNINKYNFFLAGTIFFSYIIKECKNENNIFITDNIFFNRLQAQ
jgi:hypothetical protein